LDGALTDVEVNAGACAVALGAGRGLLEALATEFDFLPGAGVEGDLTPFAGEVEVARTGAAGAGEVSATVRTVDSVELAAGRAARAGAAVGIELGGTWATIVAAGGGATGAGAADAVTGAGAGFTATEVAGATDAGRAAA